MKRWKKAAASATLGAALLFTSIAPSVKAEQTAPISSWAVEALTEGETYGIFPVEWYDDDFRAAISQQRLNTLIERTENKLAALNLEKNKAFTPVAVKGDNTRGDIVNRLYNLAAQYEENATADPAKFLQERGVLRGSEKGFMLDEQATTQHAVIFAIRLIQYTYEQADAGAKGVAWIVADEDTTIYLLGSIHLGIPDLYPVHKKLTNAFNESQGLFVEVNLFEHSGTEYYMEKAIYEEGKSIQDDISEETYAKLKQVAQQLNIQVEALEEMKPWSVTSSLSSFALDGAFGLTPEEMAMHGIDMQFLLSAYVQQKPIYELEGMQAQVDMFDSLSKEAQEESLVAILDSMLQPSEENMAGLLEEWFANWKAGDVEQFAKSLEMMNGDESEYSRMLFGKRDEAMAESIITVLEEQPGAFFVVVGAGHFLVDQNIREHLQQGGYEVKPFYEQ